MGDSIKLKGTTVLVDVGVDTSSGEFAAGLRKLVQNAINSGAAKVVVTVDKIDATRALARFKSQLETIASGLAVKHANAIGKGLAQTGSAAASSGSTSSNSTKSGSTKTSSTKPVNLVSFRETNDKRLYNIKKSLEAAGAASDSLKRKISNLRAELKTLDSAGVDHWKNRFNSLKEKADKALYSQRIISKVSPNMDKLSGLQASYGSGKGSTTEELTRLFQQANALQAKYAGIDPVKWNIKDAQQYNRIVGEIGTKMTALNKIDAAANWSKQQAINLQHLTAQADRYFATNTKVKYNSGLSAQVDDFTARLRQARPNEVKDFEYEFNNLTQAIRDAGLESETLGAQFKRLFGSHLGLAVVVAGVQLLQQALREVVQDVLNIDKAMTELRKVTSASDASYAAFMEKGAASAKKYGSTVADMLNSSADFARLGYTMDQSAELAKTANVYKNVGDGINDIGVASESIISTMKAFNIEASKSMTIVDKFNEVGNNYAISSAGIGEAMRRSASALAAAGNTLDQSIAMAVAANSVVQDPERVGTALKTLSMRLRGTKVDVEAMGESTEGMAETTSILRQKLLALTGQKVDIQIDENTYKEPYRIMLEMSKVWDSMTDIQQAGALELMGGKHNANVLASMLKDMGTAEKVLVTSLNSSGSAMKENEAVLDSIEGKARKFSATMESLAMHSVDSKGVKGFLDFVTGIVEGIDKLSQTALGFPALIAVFATILNGFKIRGGAINPFSIIQTDIEGAKHSLGLFNRTFADFSKQWGEAKGFKGKMSALFGSNKPKPDPTLLSVDEYKKFFDDYDAIYKKQGAMAANFFVNSKGDAHAKKYFATVKDGKASMNDFAKSVNLAGAAEKMSIGTKIALTAAQVALNAAYTIGLSLLISLATDAITNFINRERDAAQAAEEMRTKWKESADAIRETEGVINDVGDRYAQLHKGVSDDGKNVSLTAEEYREYNDIVGQIAERFPEMISGYTKEGNAILKFKGNVEELNKSLQEMKDVKTAEAVTNVSKVYEDFRKRVDKEAGFLSPDIGLRQKKQALDTLLSFDPKGESPSKDFEDFILKGTVELYSPTENQEALRDIKDIQKVMQDLELEDIFNMGGADKAFAYLKKNYATLRAQQRIYNKEYVDEAQNAMAAVMPTVDDNEIFRKLNNADLQGQLQTYFRSLGTDKLYEVGAEEGGLPGYIDGIIQKVAESDKAIQAFAKARKLDIDKNTLDKSNADIEEIKSVLSKIDGIDMEAVSSALGLDVIDPLNTFVADLKEKFPEINDQLVKSLSGEQIRSYLGMMRDLSTAMNGASPSLELTNSIAELLKSGDSAVTSKFTLFTSMAKEAGFTAAAVDKLALKFRKLDAESADKENSRLSRFLQVSKNLDLSEQQADTLFAHLKASTIDDDLSKLETLFRRGKIGADEYNAGATKLYKTLFDNSRTSYSDGAFDGVLKMFDADSVTSVINDADEALDDFYDSAGAAHEAATASVTKNLEKLKAEMKKALEVGDYDAFERLKAEAEALQSALSGVTGALSEFQQALKKDESPNLTGTKEAYKVLEEGLKSGEIYTRKFGLAHRQMFGDAELDVKSLGKTLKDLRKYFGEKATSNDVEKQILNRVKSGLVQEVRRKEDDKLVGYQIPDMEALARDINAKLSSEALIGLIEAVDMQVPIEWGLVFSNNEDVQAIIDKYAAEQRAEAEATPVDSAKKELPVDMTVTEGATEKVDGLKDAANDASNAAGSAAEQVGQLGADSETANTNVTNLNGALDTLAGKQIGDLGLNGVLTQASNVYTELCKIRDIKLPDKTMTIKYEVTGEPLGGTGGGTGKSGSGSGGSSKPKPKIRGYARGTVYARGGIAKVGEMGPELRITNGRREIVGANGPQIIQVRPGDRIYNARETREMLRNQPVYVSDKRTAVNLAFKMPGNPIRPTPFYKTKKKAEYIPALNTPIQKAGSSRRRGGGGGGSKSSGADSGGSDERSAQEQQDDYQKQLDELREQQKKAMQRAFSDLDYHHEMGIVNDKDYYKRLSELTNQYYSQGLLELDEYQDKRLKILEGLRKVEEDALKKQADKYKSAHSAVDKVLSKEIDRLQKERDALMDEDVEGSYGARIKALQDELETMREQNDETTRAIELGKIKESLERARTQRKSLVYREGQGFVYISNKKDLDDAQAAYDKAMYDSLVAQKEKEINQLEKDSKAQAKIFEDKIEQLQEYQDKWKEAVDTYETEQNRLSAAQLLGAEWEADTLNRRLDKMKTFVEDYSKIQAQLTALQEQTLVSFEKTQVASGAITPSLPAQPPVPPVAAYPASPYAQAPSYDYYGGSSSGYGDGFGGQSSFSSTLRKGSKGSEVAALQSALISMGFNVGSKGADGVFGAKTQAALKKYQRSQGIKANGVLGSKTQTALNGGSKKKKYAEGTQSAVGGLSVVDDGMGRELIIRKPIKGRHTFLEAGSVVYNAEKTKNLWAWGDMTPSEFMRRLTANNIRAGAISAHSNNVSIRQGDVIIKGNVDEGLLPKIRAEIEKSNANLANQLFQSSYQRRK